MSTNPPEEGPVGTGTNPAGDEVTFAPARKPVAAPAAAPVAVVLALALLALGVLGLLDGLGGLGVLDGPRVVTDAATALDGTRARTWMLVAGIGAALLGLLLLAAALKWRRRTGIQLSSAVSLWTRPGDVARIASDAAAADPDVLQATSVASRKKVKVTVQCTEQGAELTSRVKTAVQERLAPLAGSISVSVRARGEVEQ